MVVGMHRSGTSAVTHTLVRLGLAVPDESNLITPGPYNQRGYWESRRFVTLDDRVLHHLGGTWSAPPDPQPGWAEDEAPPLEALRAAAAEFAERELVASRMVLKDPRLCLTLPLWRRIFPGVPVVFIVRDPVEVARSLGHRNQFPTALGLALWRRYLGQAMGAMKGLPVLCVDYAEVVADPGSWTAQAADFLEANEISVGPALTDEAAAVIEPELRHHGREGAERTSDVLAAQMGEHFESVRRLRGAHRTWAEPGLGDEPEWVEGILQLVRAGEAVTFAELAGAEELKWIKRSRLFAANRALWRVTGRGPKLSAGPRPVAQAVAPAPGGIGQEPNPDRPEVLGEFRLMAVIKSWMDEDIIEATVNNALAQGVDAVYLVDNGSSDETVRRAVMAGASVSEVYETDAFDGRLAQALVNAVVARESAASGADHVWWLYLDSDEFPAGPGAATVREYLAGLDRRFRLVGATYLNHLPDRKPEYLTGFHPIDFQPLCYRFGPARNPPCGAGHWKHPLQRYDRAGQFVLSSDGAHGAVCSDPLVEPAGGIYVHHFQYREERTTRAKLAMARGSGRTELHRAAGFLGFARRQRSLDAVYSQRWSDLEVAPNRLGPTHAAPTPWSGESGIRRWYPESEDAFQA